MRLVYGVLLIALVGCPVAVSLGQPTPLPVNKGLLVQDDQLTDAQLRDFQELTQQKVNEFQKYLSIIADPDQPDRVRELAIENAQMLFMPNASMQVGSVKTKLVVKDYPLPIYLRRLKNLDKKYFDITITFYDLALVGDWEKTKAGYSTTATYFQRFQGRGKNGKMLYNAKTSKQMDVDLRNRKDPFYEENRWTVLLGDVRVAEIQPKKSVQ
ncbi:MAG: hypothetical protein H7Z72_25565 [Bacteroidetes bacterium]|nr:hypothetical protein [Fibrella sp.]